MYREDHLSQTGAYCRAVRRLLESTVNEWMRNPMFVHVDDRASS